MISKELKNNSCKIVILGNSGVGKSSILYRWITGEYKKSLNTTIGANHQRKRILINNEEIDLYLWDTAGQEKFQSLTPLYIRTASLAFITLSINDISSFENCEYWLSMLKESCDIIPPIFLIINKIDLINEYVYTIDQILKNYQSLFKEIYFVSAFSGEKINELFFNASKEAYFFQKNFLGLNKNPNNLNENNIKKNKNCC